MFQPRDNLAPYYLQLKHQMVPPRMGFVIFCNCQMIGNHLNAGYQAFLLGVSSHVTFFNQSECSNTRINENIYIGRGQSFILMWAMFWNSYTRSVWATLWRTVGWTFLAFDLFPFAATSWHQRQATFDGSNEKMVDWKFLIWVRSLMTSSDAAAPVVKCCSRWRLVSSSSSVATYRDHTRDLMIVVTMQST